MSLVEVLVAFVILLIAIVPMAYTLDAELASSTSTRQREAALGLAESWVEILSNSTPPVQNGAVETNVVFSPPSLPSGVQQPKTTLAGTTFAVSAEYTEQAVTSGIGQGDLCGQDEPPNASHPGVIVLHVTVSWDHGLQHLTDTTNLEYPQPGVQTDGFLEISIQNSPLTDVNGNSSLTRIEAIPVTVQSTGSTPALTLTLKPDSNGCIFAQVYPGTYTVTLGQPSLGTPQFVDQFGASSNLTQSVTVTDTQTTPVLFGLPNVQFDEGVTAGVGYGSATPVDGVLTCPGTSALTCVAGGSKTAPPGTSLAEGVWGGASSQWSSAAAPGMSTLNAVACTPASSSTCIAVGQYTSGSSSSGVIDTTQGNLSSATTDTVPAGVEDVTQAACPSDNGCYAIALTATGPELLAGDVGEGPGHPDTWVTVPALANTTYTTLSSIACPTSSICEVTGAGSVSGAAPTPGIVRLSGDPSSLKTNPSWTPTVTADTMPTGLATVGQIACPSATTCVALATGDATSATDPVVIEPNAPASGSTTLSTTWSDDPTTPTGVSSFSQLSCTSATCAVIGTLAANTSTSPSTPPSPALWTGVPGAWAQQTLPSNLMPSAGEPANFGLTGVACGEPSGSDTADCALTAVVQSGATGTGELVDGSLNDGSWAWNEANLPAAAGTVDALYSVACEPVANGGTCAAVGSTTSGTVVLTAAAGPGSSNWSVETPSNLDGATVDGVAVQTEEAGSSNWVTQSPYQPDASSNVTTLPNLLYPQPNGYQVAAVGCDASSPSAEPTAALTTIPGATPTTPSGDPATATLPLGLLPLEVTNAAGAAVPYAGLTLAAGTTSPCSTETYTLPSTSPVGTSAIAVPFGSYQLTVGSTDVGTVTVDAGYESFTPASAGSKVTAYGADPLVVPS